MGMFQSLKDRFFSRHDGAIEDFVLAAYGKLPIYKDYIIWECYHGGAAEFKQWMDETFGLQWEEFDGKNARLAGPCRAMLLMPGGRNVVAVSMWPSADEGNMRKFPFALFACFNRGEIVGLGLRGALEALDPVWRALEAEYDQVRHCANIEDLYSYFQRSAPQAEPPAEDPAEKELPLADWFEAIYPGQAGTLRKWLDSELQMALDAYRGFPEQGESLAARLPIARDLSFSRQAEFWEQLFKQNLKRCPAIPSVVIDLSGQDGPAAMNLAWRDLKREDGRLFAMKYEDYEHLENLTPDAPPRGSGEDIDPDLTIEKWIAGFAEP